MIERIIKKLTYFFNLKNRTNVCPQHSNSFTIIELLVVIAVITLLASMLLPALLGARDLGRRIKCVSNLKQFGLANVMYAADNDGWLPVSNTDNKLWDYLLAPYVNYDMVNYNTRTDYSIFHCPSGKPYDYRSYRARGYGYNRYITANNYKNTARLDKIDTPCNTAVMAELDHNGLERFTFEGMSSRMTLNVSSYDHFVYRHSDRCNVLFADGHVASCEGSSTTGTGDLRQIPKGTKWYNEGLVY